MLFFSWPIFCLTLLTFHLQKWDNQVKPGAYLAGQLLESYALLGSNYAILFVETI